MAKSESRGKGAKDGAAARAASGASPDGNGNGGSGGAGGGAAKKTARKAAGGGASVRKAAGGAAGLGDGSPALEGGGGDAATKKSAGAGGGAAKKAAGGAAAKKGSGGATAKTRSGGTAAAAGGAGVAGGSRDLGGDLREFVRSRPDGWGHDDWLGLLDDLRGRGHDVSDEGSVGMQLERERLSHRLEGIEGVKGSQTRALVDRFETVYSLRHASVDEIASVKGVTREAAERIKERFG